MIKYVHEFR